jgi:hypothetical protein
MNSSHEFMHLFLLSVISIFSLIGCKKDESTPTSSNIPGVPAEYPLSVGICWVFQSGSNYDTIQITNTKTINNQQVYQFRGNADYYFDFSDTLSGLYYKGNDIWGIKDGIERLVIPSKRDSGTFTLPHNYNDTLMYIGYEQIMGGSGSYHFCHKYKWSFKGNVWYYWIVDGAALIQVDRNGSFSKNIYY